MHNDILTPQNWHQVVYSKPPKGKDMYTYGYFNPLHLMHSAYSIMRLQQNLQKMAILYHVDSMRYVLLTT